MIFNYSKMKHASIIKFFCLFTIILSSTNVRSDNLREILILQTTDIHSHIFDQNGGWIRLATLIKKMRLKAGGSKNTLLIDCGDTLVGSTSTNVGDGELGAIMLNSLNYDAWIIGNHDFELGTKRLLSLCRLIRADKLAANLNWNSDLSRTTNRPTSEINHNYKIKPWETYSKNGAKIAVIGMTSPHIDKWLWGSDARQFKVNKMMESLEYIIPEVMVTKPDMIILAIHHGRFSSPKIKGINISKIVKQYPQIDLILGGHTHLTVPGETIRGNSWYVIPGAHAEKLAEIKVLIDIENHSVKNISSRLLAVTAKTPIDHTILNKLKDRHDKVQKFNNRKVGYIASTNSNYMNKLFGQALCEASNTKIAFITPPVKFQKEIKAPSPILRSKEEQEPNSNNKNNQKTPSLLEGSDISVTQIAIPINEEELFSIEPYVDLICTLDLTRDEVIKIIKEQHFYKKSERYQNLYGINVKKMNNKEYLLSFDDGTIWSDKTKRISIAFSSYTLAGAGGYFPILKKIALQKSSNGKALNATIRDALRDLIKKQKDNINSE